MKRFYAIVNPVAGRGAARRAWAAARAGWPAVLALGGDGTVHEVANGLLRAAGDGDTAALGIVPVGSGNDFATLAGLPRDPVAAARRVVAGGERRIDVGRVGGRWFTNGVGIGLDAQVAVEADRSRRGRGLGMYPLALARVLRTFRPPVMRVEIDGGEVIERPLTLVTVGNGGRHGGGFWLCPDARIDDGVLDVCVCDGMSRPRMLALLPRTLRGTHVGARGVHMRLARRVRITSPIPLPVHADGEILFRDARELKIEIVPARLCLLG